MGQEVRDTMSKKRIVEVLSEYTQTRTVDLMKTRAEHNVYVVVIKGENALIKASEIQRKLHEAGYITKPYYRRVVRARKHHATNGSLKDLRVSHFTSHNNIVLLKVGVPKEPISPPPFPNPGGLPVQKPKNKKG